MKESLEWYFYNHQCLDEFTLMLNLILEKSDYQYIACSNCIIDISFVHEIKNFFDIVLTVQIGGDVNNIAIIL